MRGSEKKEEKRKRRGDKEKEVGICNWTHHFTVPLREKREERRLRVRLGIPKGRLVKEE